MSVAPRRNRVVVFHGGLAHLVEVVNPVPAYPRITLLVNAWAKLPLREDDIAGNIILRSRSMCASVEDALRKLRRKSTSLEHERFERDVIPTKVERDDLASDTDWRPGVK